MYKYRRFASKSSQKLCNRTYPKYSIPDKQDEEAILETISEEIIELYRRLDICARLNHISICFDPIYYEDNVFLYGLNLAGNARTCIFYKASEVCRILRRAIRLHIDVFKGVNEETNVNDDEAKTLSCLETCIFRSLSVLDDLIFLNCVERSMFLVALFKNFDLESLEWFCLESHGKEMNALLIFLNDLFKDNSFVCDILFNNDMAREMMILFCSLSEKMYMDEMSNNFELLQTLFFSFIQKDKVDEWFIFMNKPGVQMNDSQLVFMKFLNTFLSNYTDQEIISEKLCKFIESMLNLSCISMVEIVKTQVSDGNQIFAENQKILKATEILISCAFHVSKNFKTKQLLLKNDLLKNLINLLQSIHDYSISQNKTSKTLNNDSNKITFPYFKRDIIQLLSTLCFKNKKVQDDIRELHGLELILSQCRIDDENPYLKEYAIFCLRNVLEDNEENKELLRNMKPIRLQSSEITDKLGLILEMNKIRISI